MLTRVSNPPAAPGWIAGRAVLSMLVLAALAPGSSGQTVTLVTTGLGGSASDGDSEVTSARALSNYGRYLALASNATNLVPGDINATRDVFVFDRQGGTIARVSISSGGAAGNGSSGGTYFGIGGPGTVISPDGRFVAFNSFATNLVTGDTNAQSDIFVHDRDVSGNGIFDQAGDIATYRVSVATGGAQANGGNSKPAVSASGLLIAFGSAATNLISGDNNGIGDLFLHNRQTGSTVRVNVSSTGTESDNVSDNPSISADGLLVGFESWATNLVAGDTNGFSDVFLRDVQNGTTVCVSVTSSGAPGNNLSFVHYGGAVSSNGRHVVFGSFATDLVPGDTNGFADVFVRDTVAGTTARVSISNSGGQGNGISDHGSISGDGRYVTFISGANNLAPGPVGTVHTWTYLHDRDADGNGVFDETGGISTTMISRIGIPGMVPVPGASVAPAGAATAMSTSISLVPADTGSWSDVYLAEGFGDTDGDGLPDSWETGGIDGDGNGTPDYTLASANPNRKDIYAEIDGYAGRAPSAATINALVLAFANAPVANPDGSTGITLHLVLDETTIPMVAQWGLTPWSDFSLEKLFRFGTIAERANPNWTAMRAAKVKSHHYCFFANQFWSINAIGQMVTTVSGMAEQRGNDFFVTLGAWATPGGTAQQQRGVFMHELGHNLGLSHGGADTINNKPNYHSVMNYNWTVPGAPSSPCVYLSSWLLDYSTAAWPALNESCLNEPAGISGHATLISCPSLPLLPHYVQAGPLNTSGAAQLEPETGPVDWNRNGLNDTCATANINQVPGNVNSPPGELLVGYNDWANLVYMDTSNGNWASGVHGAVSTPVQELRFEDVQALSQAGDCNGNGIVDAEDIALGSSDDCDEDGRPDECRVAWDDSFEIYTGGSSLHGSGGWKGWDNNPAFTATVTQYPAFDQPHSPYNTVEIAAPAYLVHEYCQVEPGDVWSYTAWQYIPAGYSDNGGNGSTFSLLNTYQDGGPYHWSVQMQADSADQVMKVFHGAGNNTIQVPLKKDRWVKIQSLIDLDDDWTRVYYDDALVTEYPWTGGILGGGGGALDIAAVGVYDDSDAAIYYDDLRLERADGCGGLDDDFDADGLSTDQELRLGTNPCELDSDGDAAADGADNCPLLYNPQWADTDGDTVGDACDTCQGYNDLDDCNDNALPDACDVLEGVSDDENGNLVPDECEVAGCDVLADCADSNGDGVRDDNCTWWACAAEQCVSTAISFADLGGSNGACQPDGAADANDRFHALNCFSDQNTLGGAGYPCEDAPPAAFNVDAGGSFGACASDGVCDGNDAFHALNTFAGVNPCSCCPGCSGPAPDPLRGGGDITAVAAAELSLVPSWQTMEAGEVVEIRIKLDTPLNDLRGYQLHFSVSGGRSGRLELLDMSIEDRKDHVFNGSGDWRAFNLRTQQLLAGLDAPGESTAAGAYLATLALRASRNAAGTFTVQLLSPDIDLGGRTFLFPTPPGSRIDLAATSPAVIEVVPRRAHPASFKRGGR